MARLLAASALVAVSMGPATSPGAAAGAVQPGLPQALDRLAREGKFSGAVVILSRNRVLHARGHGFADPFAGRRFTPDTPVDSASLAKPVTAAAVLKLSQSGKVDLDSPVRRYLPEMPYAQVTVRQLLAHSAGLPVEQSLEPLAGKDNRMLLEEIRDRKLPALFPPGTAFVYCNICYTTLALLVERVGAMRYLRFVREQVALPPGVTIRPARLADWKDRAIGFRHVDGDKVERADSYENELFSGSGNFSISAIQLANWGRQWWTTSLRPIRTIATTPAAIAGKTSGMTLGNWYCAPGGRRCHYLGHHEGFHHMLYWDADRQISLAMVSNNTLSPALQQRLQRALVASTVKPEQAERELATPLPDSPVQPGDYRFPTGESVTVLSRGSRVAVNRGGINYLAFRIGSGIRYVPGLDVYLAGAQDGGLHWLSLHEDFIAKPVAS